MLSTHTKITVKNLSKHCDLATPQPRFYELDLNSAAKSLMVDFTKTRATIANETITINDALELMKANRIRELMIIKQNGEFAGVISAMDLMGSKPILYTTKTGVRRSSVIVKNIMPPKSNLKAISREDVEKSTIFDVMQTLSMISEQHILVVDGEDDEMQICGYFSTSDFKRALGVTLDTPIVTHSFSDLERILNEQKEVM